MAAGELDELVTLVSYDAHWPKTFDAERSRICKALILSPDAIEHIGSTAVPGMIAKPIVDLMLGIPRYPPGDTTVSPLLDLGFQDLGEAGVTGRRHLKMRGERSFNLHIVARGGEHWTNNLKLRDYLRRNPGARERYADAKRAALAQADRLLAYSAAKHAAVSELIAAASAKDA